MRRTGTTYSGVASRGVRRRHPHSCACTLSRVALAAEEAESAVVVPDVAEADAAAAEEEAVPSEAAMAVAKAASTRT